MKNRVLVIILALFMAAGSVLIARLVMRSDRDIYLETMVEALAAGEFSGKLCYKSITDAQSQWVLYCGFCSCPVEGKPLEWSSTGICP